MAKTELNVLTLNCWGIADPTGLFIQSQMERLEAISEALSCRELDIVLLEETASPFASALPVSRLHVSGLGVFTPGACSDRAERMEAIGTAVASSHYDIVLMEEVWKQSDYEKLVAKLHSSLPHTHYFHSGMFGSGVCLFSKYPILETSMHRFVLNGYAHRVQHGDWFGGKGVGYAKLDVKGYRVHVYGTHLHAQYDEDNDDYIAHRVAQAYELGQFIKLTSINCDVVIAGGDFNLQPKDLGYKLIIANANLKDSWLVQKADPVDNHGGTTCDRPDNIYHSPAWVARNPDGLRLDYLMFRANSGVEMVCEKCELTLRQVPGKPFPYSDHEGLCATYTLRRRDGAAPAKRDSAGVEEHFMAALPVLDKGVTSAKATRIFHGLCVFVLCLLLFFLSDVHIPVISFLLRFIITIGVGYYTWSALVTSGFELSGLIATKKDINNILRCNPNEM